MKPSRQPGMIFILITLFIDILGLGLIIPILPELIKTFVGGSEGLAARYYGLIASVYALMQFFFAPLLGALSDRFGRRPVLLISLGGLGLDYLILAFAPNLAWLIIGRVIAGIAGSSITTANAYIADVSTPQTRAQNFGLVGVAFGLGFIFGPALGGLLGAINLRLPFMVAAGLALLNCLYGYFVLPESLPPERRSPFHLAKANPIGSIGTLGAYPLVAGLALAFVFISFAQRGLETVWVLYTGYRFGWGEQANGLTLGLVGVMAVLVQGFLVRPTIRWLGERRTVIYSLAFSALVFFLYGLASEGWMMVAIVVVGGLSGVAGPAVQGLVAGSAPSEDQGKLQGALTSLISLSSILAPLVFTTGLFSYFTSDAAPFILPGAPFFLGGLFFVGGLIVVVQLFRRIPPADLPPMQEGNLDEASSL
jgi:DHA1 family tetracycline resistance protein-like MFS transporter